MTPTRAALATSLASAAILVATAAPALAFHHVGVPASVCGQSEFAGGANPTATAAIREHNPAQTLPLPPVGFDNAPIDRANCPAAQD